MQMEQVKLYTHKYDIYQLYQLWPIQAIQPKLFVKHMQILCVRLFSLHMQKRARTHRAK